MRALAIMDTLRGITHNLRSQSTARPSGSEETPILDDEFLRTIQRLLDAGETHMVSLSVSVGRGEIWTQHQLKTMLRAGESAHADQLAVAEGEEILPIASITKILVAVAVILAIKGQPSKSAGPDLWANFRGMGHEPLSKLYNLPRKDRMDKTDSMGALADDPTFFDFLVHRESLPSMNHRLLSPTGQPMLLLSQLLDEILGPISLSQNTTDSTGNTSKPTYSNINYSAIALIVEALWDGTFENFMHTTLFGPLEMNSTSIGFPANSTRESHGWVVNSDSKQQRILRPRYRPDGAEAAALGAYSTVKDLDIFFKFISDSLYGKSSIDRAGAEFVRTVLELENEETKYRPLGLYTALHSPEIGSLSINSRNYPKAQFSTYPVLPSQPEEELWTYYMGGTALGCSCATAFNPLEFLHSIVVLTDTSGPVDTADHIMRLILRRLCYLRGVEGMPQNFPDPESVVREVQMAMTQTTKDWHGREADDSKLIETALVVDKDLVGVYKGVGFSQWLVIDREDDGNTSIVVRGPSNNSSFDKLKLVWIDDTRVKICVRPHLAVDTLTSCDWSNLVLKVRSQNRFVSELIRRTSTGEDRYLRQV
ncbi:beta-lactamase/transpeptidase-like protein [Paraphoma chrysanthemicola]|uniref:Beta-lactamase/transpeptidase-like protein n=1 Tax=Paraphoma chrysanthemicola TaxID=798071 RepID=A0A8K0VX27_9PLEO|nr:beta-lactamase/transpeptidase-like protein [Paraphoma chrysanthemicola]